MGASLSPHLVRPLQFDYEYTETGERLVLGKGTYGVVYAGRERHTRVRIAIKEIPERDSRCGVQCAVFWARGRGPGPEGRGSCGQNGREHAGPVRSGGGPWAGWCRGEGQRGACGWAGPGGLACLALELGERLCPKAACSSLAPRSQVLSAPA